MTDLSICTIVQVLQFILGLLGGLLASTAAPPGWIAFAPLISALRDLFGVLGGCAA
ncbi:MAG: hypothetical protein U1A27_07880 [Phycisphaerae bacterium]